MEQDFLTRDKILQILEIFDQIHKAVYHLKNQFVEGLIITMSEFNR